MTGKIASHGSWTPKGTHVHSYIRPQLKPNSVHYEGCSSDEDPDGETMCVCASIAAEPQPDPREEIECTPEMIDGQVITCGGCEACRSY